jgi:hypothetical protein
MLVLGLFMERYGGKQLSNWLYINPISTTIIRLFLQISEKINDSSI